MGASFASTSRTCAPVKMNLARASETSSSKTCSPLRAVSRLEYSFCASALGAMINNSSGDIHARVHAPAVAHAPGFGNATLIANFKAALIFVDAKLARSVNIL